MPSWGFFAEFEARPGKEEDCAAFFTEVKEMVDREPGTRAWFVFRIGPSRFRIFDVFDTEEDRRAHEQGEVRFAVEARFDELFRTVPVITPVDVIAAKLPR